MPLGRHIEQYSGSGCSGSPGTPGPTHPPSCPHLAAGQVEVLDGVWCEPVEHHGDTPVERELLTPPQAVRGGGGSAGVEVGAETFVQL